MKLDSCAFLVEAHNDTLDVPALGEELVELLLGGVVGEVADVERRALAQQLLLLVAGTLRKVIILNILMD